MALGNRYNQYSAAKVADVNMARSRFDRSHTVKDTFNFDYLVPCFVDEVIPGDTINLSVNAFARLSSYALKSPVMDNMYVDFHFFFVPNRLVWSNWEKFCGAQDNPGDTTDYIIPVVDMTAGGPEIGSIYDHMGLPTDVATAYSVNALPLRAYKRIYNEWYRDQNLQNKQTEYSDDGPDASGDYDLYKRNKKHDYFTSCLPWPQKATAVDLPLGTSAPVLGLGLFTPSTTATINNVKESDDTTDTYTGWYVEGNSGTVGASESYLAIKQGSAGFPNIYADLSSATAATINQLREAFLMQSLFELDAIAGTRYVEILQAHFKVISPDFRLQRSEFLGMGTTRFNSHPVAQTSPTSGSNAMGSLAAFGTTSTTGQNIGFTKSFVEHGYVIGIMSARADITYQQGLNRMWSRSTRYDFFWPKLQQLGEQAVLNKEIYTQGTAADDSVFGYIPRYDEYRFKPSEIRGEFRSQYASAIDYWHMAEEFSALPALNSAFIQSLTPIERALAVTTGSDILIDLWFKYLHTRPMMTYANPATLGRF